MKKLILIFLIFILNDIAYTQNQDFDKYKNQTDSAFNAFKNSSDTAFLNYKKRIDKEYSDYIKKVDKDFSDFLKKNWEEFKTASGIKPDQTPKLPELPVYTTSSKEDNQTTINITDNNLNENIAEQNNAPIIPLELLSKSKVDSLQIDFYGSILSLKFDPSIKTNTLTNYSEQAIGNFWSEISKTNYYLLIDQLLKYKSMLNLNDWGYFQLVSATTLKLDNSENNSKMLIWFLLSKSRYKIKIAYSSNKLYLIIPSYNLLYNKPYFLNNNLREYLWTDNNNEKIVTYNNYYKEADKVFDFNIPTSLNLAKSTKTKNLNFIFHERKYTLKVNYNQNMIDFFKTYPDCEMQIHFNAAVNVETKESLLESLSPLIKELPETEAAGLLLSFVQNAFQYKTDEEQFGKEKFFFAEELFAYPYSDCEDRAVLYAYLTQELLHIETVGVEYPGHICTAVSFSSNIAGDYLIYNNKKYVICDPTYVNAPIGEIMPQYIDKQAKLTPINYNKTKEITSETIWAFLQKAGLFRTNPENDMMFDKTGNCFVAGYFNGIVNIGNSSYKTEANSNDIFIACFDTTNNLKWFKQLKGKGSDIPYGLKLNETDGIYITGSFENTLYFGNNKLNTDSFADVFMLKLDFTGNFIWWNKSNIHNTYKQEQGNYFISKFDKSGQKQWTEWFSDEAPSSNKLIQIDKMGNAFVTSNISSTLNWNTDSVAFGEGASFDIVNFLLLENSRLIKENCHSTIAGLFAVINLMKNNGKIITGKEAQAAIRKGNPNLSKNNSDIFENIGNIASLKNKDGFITVTINNGETVSFSNLKISNQAKIKLTQLPNGNYKIDVISGLKVGKAFMWYDLNFVDLNKANGSLLFDYDDDHTQKTIFMMPDILNNH